MSLTSLQIKHANERPVPRHIRQSHGCDREQRIPRPTVIALDENAQKDHLVLFIVPFQNFVPNRLGDGWVGSFVHESEAMLLVGRSLTFCGFAVEVVRMDQRAGHVGFHLVCGIVLGRGNVGCAAYVESQSLLASRAEFAASACA